MLSLSTTPDHRTTPAGAATDADIPRICVALLGQENSSKTITWRLGLAQAHQTPSPEGFVLMPLEDCGAADLWHKTDETIRQVVHGAHLSTQAPEDWHCQLVHGHQRLAVLTLTDPIGQLISRVRSESPPSARQRLTDHLADLGRAQVLIVQMLCPPRGRPAELRRSVLFAANALVHALQQRAAAEPPVAVLLNLAGIDIQAHSEHTLRRSLQPDLVRRVFAPVLKVTESSERVSEVCFFVTSGFGLGRAVRDEVDGQVCWKLAPGKRPAPYNVRALLWKALMAGVRTSMRCAGLTPRVLERRSRLLAGLAADLAAMHGFYLTLKTAGW